jgi:hypothetical protein
MLEWTDRATSTFLFLCLLSTLERHLLLKLGVGIVGRGFEDRVPMVLVMQPSYISYILFLRSQALSLVKLIPPTDTTSLCYASLTVHSNKLIPVPVLEFH